MRREFIQGLTGFMRIVVALVLIFSGFVKAVDPWGTAIKLGEYFSAFSMDWLSGSEMFFSVLQSAVELTLGLALLFNIGRRFTYLVVLLLMVFFTILTLILAITNPISDCGCFGDAVKLTNWQTFAKNAVLLVFIFIVWRWHAPVRDRQEYKKLDIIFYVMFAVFSSSISMYGLRFLPVMDFLPFRVGTHIPSAMEVGDDTEITTTLIYRDLTTGENREFSLSDTAWYDTTRWEFVDTRFIQHRQVKDPQITNFAVYNGSQDITDGLLRDEVFMFTFTDIRSKGPRCMSRIHRAVEYAEARDIKVIGVTSGLISEGALMSVGEYRLPLYNIDATTLKTIIRAKAGLVVLKEGTVLGKWSCYGIPDLERYGKGNLISTIVSRHDSRERVVVIIIFISIILILYRIYCRLSRQLRKRNSSF